MIVNVKSHNYKLYGLSIGILTNPNIDSNQWMFDSQQAGCSYQFFFTDASGQPKSGIYELKDHKSTCLEEKSVINRNEKSRDAMNGSDIGMIVDCEEWTIQFSFNG